MARLSEAARERTRLKNQLRALKYDPLERWIREYAKTITDNPVRRAELLKTADDIKRARNGVMTKLKAEFRRKTAKEAKTSSA